MIHFSKITKVEKGSCSEVPLTVQVWHSNTVIVNKQISKLFCVFVVISTISENPLALSVLYLLVLSLQAECCCNLSVAY